MIEDVTSKAKAGEVAKLYPRVNDLLNCRGMGNGAAGPRPSVEVVGWSAGTERGR